MAMGLASCSWATVQKPPADRSPREVSAPVQCTDSRSAPVLDTVGTALLLGTGMTLIAANARSTTPGSSGGVVGGVVLLGSGGVTIGSAVYGYRQTSRCQAFKQKESRPTEGLAEATNRAQTVVDGASARAEEQYEKRLTKWKREHPVQTTVANRGKRLRELASMKCVTGTSCSTTNSTCGVTETCNERLGVCVRLDCAGRKVSGFAEIGAADRWVKAAEVAGAMTPKGEVPATMRQETTYTVSEAAEAIDVREETIRSWIDSGELEATRAGNGYRIESDDLQKVWERMNESRQ